MSDTHSALIAFGIDLGGQAGGWKVREVDAVGLTADWAEDLGEDGELADFMPSVSHLGVEVERYDDYETPAWILATHSYTVSDNDVFDLASLEQHDHRECDVALKKALVEIGLTPEQPRPRWLVSAYYG